MTAMPELVAGFHSLVGLAAVFVAISAFLNPEAFNLGSPGNIKLGSLIEMSIGATVGYNIFRLSNCLLKITRHNVWFTNYIQGHISKCNNFNFNSCFNLFTMFISII